MRYRVGRLGVVGRKCRKVLVSSIGGAVYAVPASEVDIYRPVMRGSLGFTA